VKVRYREKVKEYNDKLPTLEAILKDFGLNPLGVLVVDRSTGALFPPGQPMQPDLELELRAVISGG
jgi:hypothetical protein